VHGQQAFPGKGNLKPEDKILKDLRKEVEQVTRERNILKKRWPFSHQPKGKI
jgi:transposase